MLQRAYSLVSVKGFDPEKRTFSGIATSPQPDRVGDVIESKGIKFKNPLPLLLYHDSHKPVGEVRFGKATADGTPFNALISTLDRESGVVKERLDEAVDSLSAKPPLIRGVSIGFRPLEDPIFNRETGGFTFTSIEVLELSMVVVPAHQDATIDVVKSLDAQHLAAIGTKAQASSDHNNHSGDTDSPRRAALPVRRGKSVSKKTYADQIRDIEAQILQKESDIAAIQTKATDEGRVKDDAEREQFNALKGEIASLKAEVEDLRELETLSKSAAVAVAGATPDQGTQSRSATPVIKVTDPTPPENDFARAVLCKAAAFIECNSGNFVSPLQIAKSRYPSAERLHAYLQAKTAVAGGTTTDSNFAASLLAPARVLDDAFLSYLRPLTIVGKFGANGVPALKSVPFNVKIQSQTSAASASWVGQGKGKPVTKFNSTDTTLLFTKIAAISVITEELARFSSPSAETLVRDELAKAVIERMDVDFIDPAKAESSGVNPASITNGVTALASAGTSAANVLTDLTNLIEPFLIANYDVSDLVLIMPNTLAMALSLMENSLGQPAFGGIGIRGGTLRGIPVITSQHAASGAQYGNMVIAVSASNIALADDGTVNVTASREASIEMSDGPGMDATAGTGASVVSMFQTNSIAIRAERVVNWKKLRSTAVVYMDDVAWGSVGSPY